MGHVPGFTSVLEINACSATWVLLDEFLPPGQPRASEIPDPKTSLPVCSCCFLHLFVFCPPGLRSARLHLPPARGNLLKTHYLRCAEHKGFAFITALCVQVLLKVLLISLTHWASDVITCKPLLIPGIPTPPSPNRLWQCIHHPSLSPVGALLRPPLGRCTWIICFEAEDLITFPMVIKYTFKVCVCFIPLSCWEVWKTRSESLRAKNFCACLSLRSICEKPAFSS